MHESNINKRRQSNFLFRVRLMQVFLNDFVQEKLGITIESFSEN